VVLTFDDGFRDVFEHALPLLRQNRLHSIVFLVSDMVGKSNEWQQILGDVVEPLMDEVQVREWLASGQEIGSHTKTHPWLTHLSLDAAREQITASKKSLEDRFGVRVDHFCYPYGDWNQAVRDLIIEAGYKTACTTHPGINTPQTPPFELKRYLARYRTRTLKTIWQRLRVRLGLIEPAKTPGTSGRIEN
jgi:peptidoglycan/xylan/chitin deacetylase (PgdA/CDA1 family)